MPFDSLTFADIQVPVKKPFVYRTATPKERLLELARLLENDQEWRDTLMHWRFNVYLEPTIKSCGTEGCALGLATLKWPNDWQCGSCYGQDAAYNQARRDFRLTEREAEYLFAPRILKLRPTTTKEVATRIRKLVAHKEKIGAF